MEFKEFMRDKVTMLLLGWAIFSVAFYLAVYFFALGSETATNMTYIPYDGSIVIASAVLLIVVRFYGHKSMEGKVWTLLSAGIILWALAEVSWGIQVLLEAMGHSGLPSIIYDNLDYPFLAGYILLMIAFVYKYRNIEVKPNMGYTFIIYLLSGTFAIIATYLVTLPVLTRNTGLSDSEIFFQLAYVLLDILLFAYAIQISLYWGREISKGWNFLAWALFSMMIADIGYSALSIRGIYYDGNLIELAWIGAYVLFGLAANYQRKLHQSLM